jgi:hypothetical protein
MATALGRLTTVTLTMDRFATIVFELDWQIPVAIRETPSHTGFAGSPSSLSAQNKGHWLFTRGP